MGAFIGDALGLGPHWYYDLDAMRADYGPWITDYTTPKAGRFHEGMQAGDHSQTGQIITMLLESVAVRGAYDEADFCRRLDELLLPKLGEEPEDGPGGFTNHSFRQVWMNRVKGGRSWADAAGNADTSECAERISILAARYAPTPGGAGPVCQWLQPIGAGRLARRAAERGVCAGNGSVDSGREVRR